jgi:hypothetical protein
MSVCQRQLRCHGALGYVKMGMDRPPPVFSEKVYKYRTQWTPKTNQNRFANPNPLTFLLLLLLHRWRWRQQFLCLCWLGKNKNYIIINNIYHHLAQGKQIKFREKCTKYNINPTLWLFAFNMHSQQLVNQLYITQLHIHCIYHRAISLLIL